MTAIVKYHVKKLKVKFVAIKDIKFKRIKRRAELKLEVFDI